MRDLVEELRFYTALEEVMRFVRFMNRYFNDERPWELARSEDGRPRLATVLYNCAEGLRIASILLEPALPAKARQLRDSLGLPAGDVESTRSWGGAEVGAPVPAEAALLFPRAELEEAAAEPSTEKETEGMSQESGIKASGSRTSLASNCASPRSWPPRRCRRRTGSSS